MLYQNVVLRLLNRLPCISILTHHVMSKFCRSFEINEREPFVFETDNLLAYELGEGVCTTKACDGVLREPSAREAVNPLALCGRSQNITSGVLLV